MTLRIPAKVLIHVWSYDFYDMTLSIGKQRRHMINRRFANISYTQANLELLFGEVRHLVN